MKGAERSVCKQVDALRVADFERFPVWEFEDADDEMSVRPVLGLPVSTLRSRIVGTQVQLANGQATWAMINVSERDAGSTEHLVTLSLERTEHWFHLARYHDVDYVERGPTAVAAFLGLSVDEVFPISYDLRQYAAGDAAALVGRVLQEPRERLSRAQIVAMVIAALSP